MDASLDARPSSSARATIATTNAGRYLQQLCKHFAHKVPVEFNEVTGRISFSSGECRLAATDGVLGIAVTAADGRLAELKDVVARHLIRFAFREELAVDWRDAQSTVAATIGEHDLAEPVRAVLALYHQRMQGERSGSTPAAPGGRDGGQDQYMRAVGPDTGRFLNTLVRGLNAPTILEIGTSFGYSGIWLAEAARATGGRLITMELHAYKSAFAREMSERAGLADHVDFRVGDAVAMIEELIESVDFVFLDLWKDLYVPCLEAFYPKLGPGAVVVADNMIRPGGEDVRRYGVAVRGKPGITSVLLPIGSGMEVSRLETTG